MEYYVYNHTNYRGGAARYGFSAKSGATFSYESGYTSSDSIYYSNSYNCNYTVNSAEVALRQSDGPCVRTYKIGSVRYAETYTCLSSYYVEKVVNGSNGADDSGRNTGSASKTTSASWSAEAIQGVYQTARVLNTGYNFIAQRNHLFWEGQEKNANTNGKNQLGPNGYKTYGLDNYNSTQLKTGNSTINVCSTTLTNSALQGEETSKGTTWTNECVSYTLEPFIQPDQLKEEWQEDGWITGGCRTIQNGLLYDTDANADDIAWGGGQDVYFSISKGIGFYMITKRGITPFKYYPKSEIGRFVTDQTSTEVRDDGYNGAAGAYGSPTRRVQAQTIRKAFTQSIYRNLVNEPLSFLQFADTRYTDDQVFGGQGVDVYGWTYLQTIKTAGARKMIQNYKIWSSIEIGTKSIYRTFGYITKSITDQETRITTYTSAGGGQPSIKPQNKFNFYSTYLETTRVTGTDRGFDGETSKANDNTLDNGGVETGGATTQCEGGNTNDYEYYLFSSISQYGLSTYRAGAIRHKCGSICIDDSRTRGNNLNYSNNKKDRPFQVYRGSPMGLAGFGNTNENNFSTDVAYGYLTSISSGEVFAQSQKLDIEGSNINSAAQNARDKLNYYDTNSCNKFGEQAGTTSWAKADQSKNFNTSWRILATYSSRVFVPSISKSIKSEKYATYTLKLGMKHVGTVLLTANMRNPLYNEVDMYLFDSTYNDEYAGINRRPQYTYWLGISDAIRSIYAPRGAYTFATINQEDKKSYLVKEVNVGTDPDILDYVYSLETLSADKQYIITFEDLVFFGIQSITKCGFIPYLPYIDMSKRLLQPAYLINDRTRRFYPKHLPIDCDGLITTG